MDTKIVVIIILIAYIWHLLSTIRKMGRLLYYRDQERIEVAEILGTEKTSIAFTSQRIVDENKFLRQSLDTNLDKISRFKNRLFSLKISAVATDQANVIEVIDILDNEIKK